MDTTRFRALVAGTGIFLASQSLLLIGEGTKSSCIAPSCPVSI